MTAPDVKRLAAEDHRSSVRVLGIDPGTRVVGYGLLDLGGGQRPVVVAHGVIRLPPRPLAARLALLFRELQALISSYAPTALSIEQVYHGKNFQSVIKVGEARGVVVLAAQLAGLAIHEYTPATIKKTATGNGNAQKPQVARMMGRLLGLEVLPWPHDVTDALAAAYCHGRAVGPLSPASLARFQRPAPRTEVPGKAPPRSATRRIRPAARRAHPGLDLEALLRSGKARLIARKGTRARRVAAPEPGNRTD